MQSDPAFNARKKNEKDVVDTNVHFVQGSEHNREEAVVGTTAKSTSSNRYKVVELQLNQLLVTGIKLLELQLNQLLVTGIKLLELQLNQLQVTGIKL